MTSRAYHRETAEPGSLVLLFVDGVGLAPSGLSNPLSTVEMPHLEAAWGKPLTAESVGVAEGRSLAALDATLGVPGLPQSATGQTTLFTGINAAAEMGRHVTAFPGPRLRALIERHGLLMRAGDVGARATFANAYSDAYLESVASGRSRASVTTWMVDAAGGRFRTVQDLLRGRAVSYDVTRESWSERTGVEVETVSAFEAGRHLASLAADHALVIWETFLTDLAGHGKRGITPRQALEPLDGLLGGLLGAVGDGTTVLLTSDHGNLEAIDHGKHTTNPVPLLALGPEAARFGKLDSLCDVTPAILDFLGSCRG